MSSPTRFKKRKARFSFSEVHVLLDEVRKNRRVVVGKFNRGVSTDAKKRKWTEITSRVNDIGECRREVTEVVKKWSDLKCDTQRKMAAVRDLSPTEEIVRKILEGGGRALEGGGRGLEEEGEGRGLEEEEEEEEMSSLQGSPYEDRLSSQSEDEQPEALPSSGSALMLRNASLSLSEQRAANAMLESSSRSLELLSASLAKLAETQRRYVSESLALQRDAVQALKDITGGAVALLHDKLATQANASKTC